ncbi:MAG TPA: DUF6491 family protein [Rhizomicrobium sp.]
MNFRIALLTGFGALALFTTAPASAEPACLRNIDIWSFDAPNDKTVIVENTRHLKYKVSVMGTCSGLHFHNHLAFKTLANGNLACLSKGDQVISRDEGMVGICSVTNIELYTPAMQAADKAAKAAKDAAQSGH